MIGRREFLAVAGTALAGCGSRSGDETPQESCEVDRSRDFGTPNWSSERGDGRNAGAVPSAGLPAPPLSVAWTFQMEGIAGTVHPAVAGDTVVTSDYDTTAYAVDAATGAERWHVEMGDVHFDPAVVGDLALFVSDAGLRAYDRSAGEHVWTANQPDGPETFEGPPTSDGEVVCLGTDLGVVGIDAATGEHLWNRRTGLRTEASPAVADGTVYAGSEDTYVYAIDAESGSVRWRFKTRGRIECSPTVVGGTAFVGSDDGFVYALDAGDGREKWRREVGSKVRRFAATGGLVFAGTEAGLFALRASDGTRCWVAARYTGWGLAAGLDRLFAPVDPGSQRTIGAFDTETGQVGWRLGGFDGRLYNGPAIADGALYVGGVTRDGVAMVKLVEE